MQRCAILMPERRYLGINGPVRPGEDVDAESLMPRALDNLWDEVTHELGGLDEWARMPSCRRWMNLMPRR